MEHHTDDLKSFNKDEGFFNHVFNFDKESKNTIMNILQYSVIALIPVVILNKSMQKFVPEADDDKGSIEIIIEILLQLIVIFIGMLLVHRIVTYIPTQSGEPYPKMDVTNIILSSMTIILSLQSKLGEKVNILSTRIMDMWNGTNQQDKQQQRKHEQNQSAHQPRATTTPIHTLPTTHNNTQQNIHQVVEQPFQLSAANEYPSESYAAFR